MRGELALCKYKETIQFRLTLYVLLLNSASPL